MADSFRCPICHREVAMRDEGARFRPFCSTRCRTIDLGSWLEGHYRVASTADEEEDPTGDIVKPDSDDV